MKETSNIQHRTPNAEGRARTVVFRVRQHGRTNGEIRPIMERLMWMAGKLRAGEPLNCTIAARHWEVSTKTIFRDLEFLRDRLCYEFKFKSERHSYVLVNAPKPVL